MGDHFNVGIDGGDRGLGALDFGCADAISGVGDLALQVGEVDHIVIDHADGADTGGGEIEDQRRPQTAGADHQHFGIQQLLLADPAHFPQQDMAGVAVNLLLREIHRA